MLRDNFLKKEIRTDLRDKYDKIPIQVKASMWYTICNFFQKGVSFVVMPIYTRLLTTGEYGEWSVFQAWRDILIIFASLNLYAGVYTKALVDNRDDRDRYTSSMQGLGTLISLGLLVVYFFSYDRCNYLFDLNTPQMLLLFLYFVVYPAFSFWNTRQRVEYRYKLMAIVAILGTVLIPLVSIFLLINTTLRAKALILGYLIVQCSIGSFFYIYHFWKGKIFFHKDYWKYALKFNIPLIPHYLSLIILGQADRIMIKNLCGESDAGIYSFAYQIAFAINVFISSINGSRVPWTYEQLKAKNYGGIAKVVNMLTFVMAMIVLFVSIISPEVIKVMGSNDYQAAMYVIPVVALGVFFTYVYDLYASIEFYYGATKYVMYASVTGALMNIILNYIFISVYGFIAAAYTTLICYGVFMLMHFFFSKKVLKSEKIDSAIYDNTVIFTTSFIIVVLCMACILVYSYPLIRALLVLAVGVVFFIKRKYLKDLIVALKK